MERKRQQAHVRRLEWKMHRLREVCLITFSSLKLAILLYSLLLQHDEWATRQQPLMKFIKLTTTPPLYYKPKVWTPKTEELLKESQRKLKGEI